MDIEQDVNRIKLGHINYCLAKAFYTDTYSIDANTQKASFISDKILRNINNIKESDVLLDDVFDSMTIKCCIQNIKLSINKPDYNLFELVSQEDRRLKQGRGLEAFELQTTTVMALRHSNIVSLIDLGNHHVKSNFKVGLNNPPQDAVIINGMTTHNYMINDYPQIDDENTSNDGFNIDNHLSASSLALLNIERGDCFLSRFNSLKVVLLCMSKNAHNEILIVQYNCDIDIDNLAYDENLTSKTLRFYEEWYSSYKSETKNRQMSKHMYFLSLSDYLNSSNHISVMINYDSDKSDSIIKITDLDTKVRKSYGFKNINLRIGVYSLFRNLLSRLALINDHDTMIKTFLLFDKSFNQEINRTSFSTFRNIPQKNVITRLDYISDIAYNLNVNYIEMYKNRVRLDERNAEMLLMRDNLNGEIIELKDKINHLNKVNISLDNVIKDKEKKTNELAELYNSCLQDLYDATDIIKSLRITNNKIQNNIRHKSKKDIIMSALIVAGPMISLLKSKE